jgi:hypothetical protein
VLFGDGKHSCKIDMWSFSPVFLIFVIDYYFLVTYLFSLSVGLTTHIIYRSKNGCRRLSCTRKIIEKYGKLFCIFIYYLNIIQHWSFFFYFLLYYVLMKKIFQYKNYHVQMKPLNKKRTEITCQHHKFSYNVILLHLTLIDPWYRSYA